MTPVCCVAGVGAHGGSCPASAATSADPPVRGRHVRAHHVRCYAGESQLRRHSEPGVPKVPAVCVASVFIINRDDY